MSEKEFAKFKKWIIGIFGGQFVAVVIAGLISYGAISTTTGQNTKDIDSLKNSKADLQTVLRIKADMDIRDQMILDQLKGIENTQRQTIDLLVKHMERDKR